MEGLEVGVMYAVVGGGGGGGGGGGAGNRTQGGEHGRVTL